MRLPLLSCSLPHSFITLTCCRRPRGGVSAGAAGSEAGRGGATQVFLSRQPFPAHHLDQGRQPPAVQVSRPPPTTKPQFPWHPRQEWQAIITQARYIYTGASYLRHDAITSSIMSHLSHSHIYVTSRAISFRRSSVFIFRDFLFVFSFRLFSVK
ncbi:hypothetical protein E2C01_088003 [Portunus trituberculatus]|uniref:Uncharacterized protein n=1 Tax=Portunus trituberculatus TaxID=210409 RepID=A0A5B7J818_PORTR|nr:hypothetical protein [Portunus trituberculatus]